MRSDIDDADYTSIRYPDRDTQPDEKLLMSGFARLPKVLNQLQYDGLRPGQDMVVANVMAGKDAYCVMPTAFGKTSCYVIPTLCLNWRTIVFSPLVSLMRDQVQQLSRKGVRVAQMSSTQTAAQNSMAARLWANGELDLFYIAPERLRNSEFNDAIKHRRPDFVAADEVHCCSTWGFNFRPDYCAIGDFVAAFRPRVVAGFTATSSDEIEEDVRRILGMRKAQRLAHYYRRSNLKLSSMEYIDDAQIAGLLKDSDSGSSIVYCSSIKRTEKTAANLGNLLDEDVGIFHGDLTPAAKASSQDLFMNDRVRIICATKAFGMGVDKASIQRIIHRDIPSSLEDLSQEIGRAGRNGKLAECTTLFSSDSLNTQRFFLSAGYPGKDDVVRVFNAMRKHSDHNGVLKMTAEQIAAQAGLDNTLCVSSIVTVLAGARVIEREKSSNRIATVRMKGSSEEGRFKRFMSKISELAKHRGDEMEIDLSFLSDALDLGEQTVKKYLLQWSKNNLIDFVPPFRGSVTKITGGLERVDFDKLVDRRNRASAKLDMVVEYALEVDDYKKHDYLEAYFNAMTVTS